MRNATKIYKGLKKKRIDILELKCTVFEITIHCGDLSKKQEDEELKK